MLEGWADLAELQTRRKNSSVSPGFMAMIAETRAKRRVTLAALGLPAGVAEEVSEGQEYAAASESSPVTTLVTVTKPKPELGKPANLPELLARAYSEKHMSVNQVLAKLGSLDNITDFGKAWDTL